MKNQTIANILLYLMILSSVPATANDYSSAYPSADEQNFHNLYSEQIIESQALPKLIENYIAQWPEPLNIESLFSLERQKQHYKIFRLTAVAIDADVNVKPLQTYGLMPHSQTSYLISLTDNPHWINLTQLVNFINKAKDLSYHQQPLLQFGFSPSSIQQISKYLNQQPLKKQLNQITILVKQQIKQQSLEENWSQLHTGYQLTEAIRYETNYATNRWAMELIEQLDTDQQQKFIDYLYQQLNYIGIAKSPISEQKLIELAQQLVTAERLSPQQCQLTENVKHKESKQ